jgi:hypothetical protein
MDTNAAGLPRRMKWFCTLKLQEARRKKVRQGFGNHFFQWTPRTPLEISKTFSNFLLAGRFTGPV